MIHIDEVIVVEGKYDKERVRKVTDAPIICTHGFELYRSKRIINTLRKMSNERGIIILTDSDSAGAVIRAYLKKILGDTEIINVYVPELKGKERRKTKYSKEGLLGVEGMSPEIIAAALEKSGVLAAHAPEKRKITKTDMFSAGLSGRVDSAAARRDFLRFSELPQSLSSSAMLDVLNNMLTYDEFKERVALWQKSRGNA